MELLTTIAPLDEAVKHFGEKSVVASTLRSREWADVPLALRESAFFSSALEDARALSEMQAKLRLAIGLTRENLANGKTAFVDRSSFIGDLRKLTLPLSNSPNPFADRGITNIASRARLGLIYDMQVQNAQGYAGWKMDNDPDVLDAWPAQRLYRAESRRAKRDWMARWQEKGNKTGWQGASRKELVALKTSPIWAALSRFGTPWPPFDFGSGMELEDVSRADAERLGLVAPGARIEPVQQRDYNASLQASVANIDEAALRKLKDQFGDQVVISGSQAKWQGNLIGDLFDDVAKAISGGGKFDSRAFKGRSIAMGKSTPAAIEKAAPHADLTGAQMQLRPDNIVHFLSSHGPGAERRKNQRPVTSHDVRMLPFVWRHPDSVRAGDKPRSLVFEKDLDGTSVMAAFDEMNNNVWQPRTLYIKKESGQ